jgi:hypothetical protein
MPYHLAGNGNEWFVVKDSDGKRMSKRPMTKAKAKKQLAALYASESKKG